ncbi:hypothetical protein JCM33374_g6184 [Metschnikowia sp. JCM 33374]|nr:hypothetical protein JCM33374_g6184 [Metschnikowia sp. JCM 33374]
MTSKEPPSKMSLEEFFGKLKKFVNETNFDADGFAGQQETLEAEFSAITASSESGKSKKVFARRVFQTMIDAARCMAWYGTTSRPDHDLVYTAVELYVRALALHNIHGSPDVSMEDCKNRIKHLYQETRSLKSKLAMLSGPPVYVIVMLFDQIFRTTKTLKGLMAMLVEPEEAEFPC